MTKCYSLPETYINANTPKDLYLNSICNLDNSFIFSPISNFCSNLVNGIGKTRTAK